MDILCFILSFTVIFKTSTAQMVPAVFMFGDSLVDVGNNNHLPVSFAKANFPHNGIDFPNKKATGRFSNGKNAADFIAEKVGLPTSPPYKSLPSNNVSAFITGVSFASGGAGIFNTSDLTLGQAIPLTQQVGEYESIHGHMVQHLGASGAEKMLSKSLFCIVIGSNDIFGYSNSSDHNEVTSQQYVDSMTLTLKELITRIHNTGGRKFFVAGVPPVGCTPAIRSKQKFGVCNEEINSIAAYYNGKLISMLHELTSALNGLTYSYFNTYTSLDDITHNPSSYGFTEVKAACCGLGTLNAQFPCTPISKLCSNRSSHVFWDLYHPTEAAARIIVDNLFDGPSHFSTPFNLRHLITS
ncbi:GDSL esterase/lipase At5g55050-like [Euphorbia lathyris]|uniref:GDSL esterase/lipase At5g55050-like n=1 Tax=Euphorbia lathyris TaxID=212925 RepID=UPI0033143BA0